MANDQVIKAPERFGILAEDRDPEAYARFIGATRHKARLFQTSRNVIVLRGEDRPGILAAATNVIADMGLNIEAALQGLSRGHGSLVLVTSAIREVDPTEITAALDASDGLQGWNHEVVPFRKEPLGIPTSDYSLWYLKASREHDPKQASLLGQITRVLGDLECVLVETYSTVTQDNGSLVEHIDINVALPGDIQPGKVRGELQDLQWRTLEFDPTDRPRFECVADRNPDHQPNNAATIAVLGDARAGLMADIVVAIEADHGMAVMGCTMAVLEGRTAAVFAVEHPDGSDVWTDKEDGLCRTLASRDALHVFLRPLTPRDGGQQQNESAEEPSRPMRLTWYVDERPGVLRRLSDAIYELRLNVERLSARVISDDPICVINMFLMPTDESADNAFGRLEDRLAQLKEEAWGSGSIEAGDEFGFLY